MRLLGTVTDCHQLTFNEVTNGLKHSFLQSCKPGQVVSVEMKKVRPDKTHQQVKAIWAMIVPAAKAALDHAGIDCMGVPLCEDQVKQILYRFCGGVGENGEIVSLSKQNIDQASEFFENSRLWLAENFQFHVPDPDPNWRQHATRKAQTQV